MIKLIATDLDGTLLDDEKRMPREIFGLIGQLHAKNILFAPASGRQYANLKTLFSPVWDKLVFICENGALVKYRGETLWLDPVPEECLRDALQAIRAIPHLYPMLCGENCAYIENGEEPFCSYAHSAYTNCERVESLECVIGREKICKIAVYDELPASEHCLRLLPSRLPALRTAISGSDWCDVSAPTADKGKAIDFIRGYFGFKREECAAFGDHMNDYEMLLACGYSYVTENAYPPLKTHIPNVIPSNNEKGVLQKIIELMEET